MFPGTHEPPPWDDVALDLRQMDLHHHTFLSGVSIPDLCDSVPRSSNLQENLAVDGGLRWRDSELVFLHVTSCTPCEIRLVLLTLRVCKVRALVSMESEAETTFQRAEMVAEDIWILRVRDILALPTGWVLSRTHFGQVDCFQSQLLQTFSPIHVGLRGAGDTSTTELRTDSILEDNHESASRWVTLSHGTPENLTRA